MSQGQVGDNLSKLFPSEELRWFALRVEPNKEEMTVRILENKSMLALFPTYEVERNLSRYVTRTITVERPSLMGYVFIAFPQDIELPWWAVRKIHLIRSVVCVCGKPAQIDYDAMWRLFAPPGFFKAQVQIHKRVYGKGQKVKMTAGAFTGIKATVEDVTEDEAIVRLGLLGGALVNVSLDDIESLQIAAAA